MISLPLLLESYYISIFINNLKDEIKSMVKIMQPPTLAKAFEIALLQENSITALNKGLKTFKAYFRTKWSHPSPSPNEPPTKPTPYSELNPKKSSSPLKFKDITPFDFQTKKELGLCYKYDEKYSRGHVCKNKILNFILVDKEVEGS